MGKTNKQISEGCSSKGTTSTTTEQSGARTREQIESDFRQIIDRQQNAEKTANMSKTEFEKGGLGAPTLYAKVVTLSVDQSFDQDYRSGMMSIIKRKISDLRLVTEVLVEDNKTNPDTMIDV